MSTSCVYMYTWGLYMGVHGGVRLLLIVTRLTTPGTNNFCQADRCRRKESEQGMLYSNPDSHHLSAWRHHLLVRIFMERRAHSKPSWVTWVSACQTLYPFLCQPLCCVLQRRRSDINFILIPHIRIHPQPCAQPPIGLLYYWS